MAVSFQPLFSIELFHGYFADGLCRRLSLAPTADTSRLFERYRLMFRPSLNGGAVSWAKDPNVDYLHLFNETVPFAFTLTCTDSDFSRYTEMGAEASAASPAETVHYFNNLAAQTDPAAGAGGVLLHPPGQPFAGGPLPVRSGQSLVAFDPPVQKATLKIIDTLDGLPAREFKTPDGDTREFPIDLSDLPAGRYGLAINRKQPEPFYLSDVPAVRQFGFVEIYAGGPAMGARVPEAARAIGPAGEAAPKRFAVRFLSRRTTWRYYVFSAAPGERNFDGYQVVGQSRRPLGKGDPGPVRFLARPEPVELQGRRARVFESEQPIPLWQIPGEEHLYTLKPDGSHGAGPAYPLPYAQPGSTRLESDGTARRMVSEIFVYL